MIESKNGGAFLSLMGDLVFKALDKLSNNSQQWDFLSCWDKSALNLKKGGNHELYIYPKRPNYPLSVLSDPKPKLTPLTKLLMPN
jgi:hypothetical protein